LKGWCWTVSMMNNDGMRTSMLAHTKVGVSWDEVVELVDPLFPNHTQLLACSWSSQLPVTVFYAFDVISQPHCLLHVYITRISVVLFKT
jgi:hypothetical protein